MKKLTNKVAFVTGGSRGMGAAIATKLADEGATVVITFIGQPDQAEAVVDQIKVSGGHAIALKANNLISTELTGAIDRTIREFRRIDILVNNAGIYLGKPFLEHTLEDYNQIMTINVQAVFVATHAALKAMPEGGRIISIGSNMGDNAIKSETTLYTMSKSALQGFTRGLARDLGSKRITVNLVQPGPTNTEMNPADGPAADYLRSRMALQSFGTVDDIAAFVNFLASEEAKYITGSLLTIDGGLNA